MVQTSRQSRARRLLTLTLGCAAAVLLAGGCAGAPLPQVKAASLRIDHPVTLIGEVHDNTMQHALRVAALRRALAAGQRPALVMEMFDRGQQPVIDRLRDAAPPAGAASLIEAAGGPGWDWSLYAPYVELALTHGLPLIAANISRDEARRVMRDGLEATGFDPAVPATMLRNLTDEIVASHCGLVDRVSAGRMALAQVARDQAMATAVRRHADRGVVLLAGNGHVRNDAGVPHWLDPATRARSVSIGLLEEGADAPARARYDRVVVTPAQPRGDPCAGMRRPAARSVASGQLARAPDSPHFGSMHFPRR